MNKKFFHILLIIISVISLSSCTYDNNKEPLQVGVYSNLLDTSSQKELKKDLENAGIPAKDIESFFQQVNYFNSSINEYGLVKEGFKEKIKLEPDYDPYEMQDLWDEKNPEFIGYNCRITSYNLMKDLIDIGDYEKESSDILIFDENSIENSPISIFNQNEIDGFRTLYHPIKTDNNQDLEVQVGKVKDYWKSKNISFKNEGTSLISVFFHEEDGYLFIGHVGVLIPDNKGNLLFIEKVAFQEPYQVIRFKDRSDLNDYLMKKYNISWGQNTIPPFIMENDKLMEGYKVVSNNN